jgi:hypothetical protein
MFFHIRCFDSRRLNLNNAFIVCVIWSMEIFELNTLDFRILLCIVAIERGIFNPRMFMRVVNTLHVVLVAWIPILKRSEDLSETDYCLYTIVWFNFLVDEEIMQLMIVYILWSYLFECARTKTYLIRRGIFYAVLCSQC